MGPERTEQLEADENIERMRQETDALIAQSRRLLKELEVLLEHSRQLLDEQRELLGARNRPPDKKT